MSSQAHIRHLNTSFENGCTAAAIKTCKRDLRSKCTIYMPLFPSHDSLFFAISLAFETKNRHSNIIVPFAMLISCILFFFGGSTFILHMPVLHFSLRWFFAFILLILFQCSVSVVPFLPGRLLPVTFHHHHNLYVSSHIDIMLFWISSKYMRIHNRISIQIHVVYGVFFSRLITRAHHQIGLAWC